MNLVKHMHPHFSITPEKTKTKRNLTTKNIETNSQRYLINSKFRCLQIVKTVYASEKTCNENKNGERVEKNTGDWRLVGTAGGGGVYI